MLKRLLIILLVVLPLTSFAQKKKKDKRSLKEKVMELFEAKGPKDSLLIYDKKKEETDTLPDVPLKKKKNVYFGVKTKRAYTVGEASGRTVIEDFYIIPDPVEVDGYVLQISVHDNNQDRIRRTRPRSKTVSRVLHGPYKKLIDDVLVEEGMYFYGTKHLRWVRLNRQNKLVSKEHFHKGWYRDSEITYYDGAGKTQLETVTPIQYGKKEGRFIHFFANGQIAVQGLYQFDKKVGIWEEYHQGGTRLVKREIQYPPDAFQKDFKPYIRKEWDAQGNLIYESPKLKKKG